jgi:hypothetical protein
MKFLNSSRDCWIGCGGRPAARRQNPGGYNYPIGVTQGGYNHPALYAAYTEVPSSDHTAPLGALYF